jgi:hypothetical protein
MATFRETKIGLGHRRLTALIAASGNAPNGDCLGLEYGYTSTAWIATADTGNGIEDGVPAWMYNYNDEQNSDGIIWTERFAP